jgi:hypothetical protein
MLNSSKEMTTMEQIYALYYEYADERQYFYVGRTERDPKIRLREHRSKVRKGTEDVYKFIREQCQPNGIDVWEMELLVNDQGDPTEDCEDFWVVLMIRAGHDLKNMKHGDLRKIAQLKGLAQAKGDFTTVKEFIRFRDDYERSERLKREVLEQTPSPRGDLQTILTQAQANFQEKNAFKMQQRRAKEARDRANALEREAWLRSLKFFGEPGN